MPILNYIVKLWYTHWYNAFWKITNCFQSHFDKNSWCTRIMYFIKKKAKSVDLVPNRKFGKNHFFSKCVATTNCYLYVLNTHVAIRCDDLRPTNKRKGFKIPSMERKLFPKILRVALCWHISYFDDCTFLLFSLHSFNF